MPKDVATTMWPSALLGIAFGLAILIIPIVEIIKIIHRAVDKRN